MIEAIQGREEASAQLLAQSIQNGYSKSEIDLEPEFSAARKTSTYQHLPPV